MGKSVALIAGVTGAVGTQLAIELIESANWTVHGLSRSVPASRIRGLNYIETDLQDKASCSAAINKLSDITHVFYCARATHGEQVLEDSAKNLSLLANLVDAVETISTRLEHIHLVQGGKYYGVHVGPIRTPAREEDPRAPVPNFNYAQQDYLASRSPQANWSWSCSRPNTLLHFSPSIARNLVSSLVCYAAICRELGAALDFPGPPAAFRSLTQLSTLSLVAKGITWASTEPRCANQGFNFTNTDLIRWQELWPKLADALNMSMGIVRPMKLADVMQDRDDVWQTICQRQNLKLPNLAQVANWAYLDATLERTWDEILCHNKVRELGFDEWDNSEQRFFDLLGQYQNASILPT